MSVSAPQIEAQDGSVEWWQRRATAAEAQVNELEEWLQVEREETIRVRDRLRRAEAYALGPVPGSDDLVQCRACSATAARREDLIHRRDCPFWRLDEL